ncbi:MAG: c-type cytochrome [Planctomycetota bacterium]|nr:MAG: c-type cytochrome [Planctomycetota bacterium]
MLRISLALASMLVMSVATWCLGAAPEAVKRGESALTGRALNPAAWTAKAYENAWCRWDMKASQPPADYAQAFREHYGVHAAPYANAGYPMGLREAPGLLGKGITTDCLLCHGGSIAGQSYIGLGNTALDIQALFEDLSAADGRSPKLPFTFCNVRGTSEAGAMSVYLFSWREPDLKLRRQPLDLGLRDDLCEDVPAWWLLKKKKTMYYTGSGDARSVRSLMQFMLTPLNTASTFEREEPAMANIQAYILSLKPPAYPFAVDRTLAARGEQLFKASCSRCHGTYGEKWTYPNKVVSLEEIGTDPNRYFGVSNAFHAYYQRTWFAHEKPGWLVDDCAARHSRGYQAPPLDGIWATAPYFHNGSAPTVYDVLNSTSRPKIFTRSYRTDRDAYDPVKLGWKVDVLGQRADSQLPAIERRKIYDTSQPGRSNAGHTFGDDLTEEERMAVIEYLKTI